MKFNFCRIIATALVVALLTGIMALTAGAHTISAEVLERKVNAALQPGRITYAFLYDVDKVSGSDLRKAASTAISKGGKVFLNFETLNSDRVIARITINPNLVKSDAGDFNFLVGTASDDITKVDKTFTEKFGKDVVVFKANMLDFGMYVVMSAKLDLGTMDKDNLIAYSYDKDANTYSLLEDASCTVDSNGFLNLQTSRGGYILITTK